MRIETWSIKVGSHIELYKANYKHSTKFKQIVEVTKEPMDYNDILVLKWKSDATHQYGEAVFDDMKSIWYIIKMNRK